MPDDGTGLRGLGDTSILICLERLAADQLPSELALSTANRLPLFTTNPGIRLTEMQKPSRAR
jgi:hypothetical protein